MKPSCDGDKRRAICDMGRRIVVFKSPCAVSPALRGLGLACHPIPRRRPHDQQFASCRIRCRRPRRNHLRRLHRAAPVPDRRRAGLRQDDAGTSVPHGRRAARRDGAVRHALGNRRRAARRQRVARLGPRGHRRSASSFLPKAACAPTTSTRCSTRRKWSSARRRRPFSRTWSACEPQRVVFDSLSELRLLAGNPLRYRRQILALKQFFVGRNCTVLLLDDLTSAEPRPAGAKHRARRDPAGADLSRITARSGGASSCSSTAGCRFAAATTTS